MQGGYLTETYSRPTAALVSNNLSLVFLHLQLIFAWWEIAILKLFILHILQSLAAKFLLKSALGISPVLYEQVLNLVYEHPEDATDVPKHVKVAKDYNLNVSVVCAFSLFCQ